MQRWLHVPTAVLEFGQSCLAFSAGKNMPFFGGRTPFETNQPPARWKRTVICLGGNAPFKVNQQAVAVFASHGNPLHSQVESAVVLLQPKVRGKKCKNKHSPLQLLRYRVFFFFSVFCLFVCFCSGKPTYLFGLDMFSGDFCAGEVSSIGLRVRLFGPRMA